jgi:hypothetical protein
MDGPRSWRRIARRFGSSSLAPLLLIWFVVSVTYADSLGAYFHGDDFVAFTDLVSKPRFEHIVDVFAFRDSDFYWRPLGELYYMLIYELAGLDPFFFYLGNLVVFLLTLTLGYLFCLGLRLSPTISLFAVLLFGLFPNHVVSVAWVSNGPRLLATMFLMLALVILQTERGERNLIREGAVWLCFIAACLSDEVAMALAPVPVAYAVLFNGESHGRAVALRSLAYLCPVAVLGPLQFIYSPEADPRWPLYHLGFHLPEQLLAMTSQLVLPIGDPTPMEVPFSTVSDGQWFAGAIVLIACLLLFAFGSKLVRFLVFWVCLALAPFALWDWELIAPRYVYMAAFPFALLVTVVTSDLLKRASHATFQPLGYALALLVLCGALTWGARESRERNNKWAADAARFESLASGLQQAMPTITEGSRIVIYYGVWEGLPLWPEAVVRTIYKDPTLQVLNIAEPDLEGDWRQQQAGDLAFFYLGNRFLPATGSIGPGR